ncbi:Uncharacterised protein [Leminorella richardii]|uniref:RNA ligase domain-containing protein n=1 Tax=Leminorella richardii TaxID=158841 RepID=A0A2X4URD8_9GAMM|nr:Uncharacterised protein [Leminorella richardii]
MRFFGENLYAIHSIEYRHLEHDFFVFAVRCKDCWLSWEEVKFYAALFDFPLVPELEIATTDSKAEFGQLIVEKASEPSRFLSWDTQMNLLCSMEGIVSRNRDEYPVDAFMNNVFKYVRKNHVKTDVHWKRNWKRAPLYYERQSQGGEHELAI